jgi:aspartate beta-hydroxylase
MPPPPPRALERAATLVRSGLLRTRAAHRPAPALFTYPGLASRPWWALHELPDAARASLDALWGARATLLAEYDALASAAGSDYSLGAAETKLHTGEWRWHSAVSKGALQPTLALAAPVTAGLLQRCPALLTGVPFAYAFFSNLRGGARIAPHHGPCNLRLRVHLPLRVPSDDAAACGIRVGGAPPRAWTEPLVFDDSYEHETWNDTGGDRVVLLLDLWHPELSALERESVTDRFGEARRPGWMS